MRLETAAVNSRKYKAVLVNSISRIYSGGHMDLCASEIYNYYVKFVYDNIGLHHTKNIRTPAGKPCENRNLGTQCTN